MATTTSTPGLDGAIKALSDLVKDTLAAIQSSGTLAVKLAAFSNLFTDFITEAPLLAGLKTEVSGLLPADYGRLAGEVATDAALSSAHAVNIVNAFLKLINDGAISDVVGLINAIETKV
jgi:hypothetical protein